MNTIEISRIKVSPNRQRRVFDPIRLQELRADIEESQHGLLSPIVLRPEGTDLYLVAGERRLRAVTDIYDLGGVVRHAGVALPAGHVPFTLLSELDPLAAWEAELSENIHRADLTWQERAAATDELRRLRTQQAEAKGEPAPSAAAIAAEVRPEATPIAALDAARKEVIVAKHLADPEVRAAPSLNEAFKILKKKEERQQNERLAERVGKTFTSKAHTLLNVDAREWLQSCPSGRFPIILSDPPYGMGADEFGDSGQGVGAAAHFYDDSYESWSAMMSWFVPELCRVAMPNAHCYLFCDLDRFHDLKSRMESAGWKVHRTPLIWSNPDGFRAPWPKQGPQRRYELVLYAIKGDRPTNSVRGDVLEYKKDAALGHPAQKPVNLLIDLLARSAKPGDEVLDPCAGSGATLAACHELKLSCTALEMDAGAYGIAVKRLETLTSQQEIEL